MARELSCVSLGEALELTILIARKEPGRLPKVAVRWGHYAPARYIPCMNSVAYPAQPTGPGWWTTAWLMFLGWLAAALALGGLYVAGTLLGVIGRNGYTGAGSGVHAINDWPFASNGTWSLLADSSVFALALVVTTIAIAWQLRGPFETVSEDRLMVVLLFTGGAPLVTTDTSAPLFFLVAVWAVRAWVVKDEFRFPRRPLLAIGALFVLTIASYGLFHPVWVESASPIVSHPTAKRPTVMLVLHNGSRASMTIERVSAGGYTDARAGWPGENAAQLPLRIAGGKTAALMLKMQPGNCGNGLYARVRYRLLGRTLQEPFNVTVPDLRSC